MNDQLNQTGQVSNSQDGCETNSRRYDSFTTGPVRSAIPSNSWASCQKRAPLMQRLKRARRFRVEYGMAISFFAVFLDFGIYVVSPVYGGNLRKLNTGAELRSLPHRTVLKPFLYSNAFVAKSCARSPTFKNVPD